MNLPKAIPENKQSLLKQLTPALARIPGVEAIVLGGSYARGTQREDSDLDLGLYYFESAPFAVTGIKQVAAGISTGNAPVVTDFYEWGPWVNGGAWIQTAAGKVDFLYRNLNQVERTIQEAARGIVKHDYNQQPAYGFYSLIYLAETRICVPLHDPHEYIARLKRQVEPYPAKLKQKIVADWLWLAEFTLIFARNFAAGADVYNTVGCLTRIASCLTQVLFALNETYFIADKQVMAEIAAFPLLPAGYVDRLSGLLAHPGQTPAELSRTVSDLEAVWRSVVSLAGDMYQPKFSL